MINCQDRSSGDTKKKNIYAEIIQKLLKLTNQETFTKGEKYRKHIYYTVYYTVVPSTLVQVIEETFQIVEV